MTQAHLDLQLEPSPSDPTTQPLFNDSPVLFHETLDQVDAHPSEQVEQVPPPPKKRYEIMKDPVILSSPIFLPKNTFSTITFYNSW